MARESRPIVKLSGRESYALHPKAHKALVKRTGPPGQRGNYMGRTKSSQYSLQLREKQKVKRLYGLLERQFSKLMQEASQTKGQSGATLLQFLERRFDNVVYRAGFAPSRNAARQLTTHGHFLLNGKRVDIPSIRLSAGDKVELREVSKKNDYFKNIEELSPAPASLPGWIKVSRKQVTVEITGNPAREEAEPDI